MSMWMPSPVTSCSSFFRLLWLGLVLVVCSNDAVVHQDGKEEMQMAQKVSELMDLSYKRSVVRFNGNKFREFARNSPRNYSILVMFTAMNAQRQCSICAIASEEFQIVANSYRYSTTSKSSSSSSSSVMIFFAMVDFDDAPDVFQLMKLNTAPVFMHFPAKGKPKKADTMDLQRVGLGADAIAKWINERTEVSIKLIRPTNYTGLMVILLLLGLVVGLLYLRRNNLEFLCNKSAWGFIIIAFVLAMLSGQMWNHIRGPPLMQQGNGGSISYIHGSSNGQFVMETYFVMLIYAAIVVGMIMLIEAADGKGDAGKNRVFAIVGLALFAFFFSLLLSVFRSKAGGYPYSFLLK